MPAATTTIWARVYVNSGQSAAGRSGVQEVDRGESRLCRRAVSICHRPFGQAGHRSGRKSGGAGWNEGRPGQISGARTNRPIRGCRQGDAADDRRNHPDRLFQERCQRRSNSNRQQNSRLQPSDQERAPWNGLVSAALTNANMLDTTNLLWYSSIAVEFLFCLHLIWTKLAKSYPIFTVCLGCSVLAVFGGHLLHARSRRPAASSFLYLLLALG